MGEQTGISWADGTFNPWWGCVEVGGSPACGGPEFGGECYAKTWDRRVGGAHWGSDAPRRFFGDKHWAEPLKWNREAEKSGVRRRIFCMSMGDWAEGRPDQAASLERLWDLIDGTPMLDWMMLTKRPQLISRLYPKALYGKPNVWLGITAENQPWFDMRWKFLQNTPSAVYWISVEPQFGPIILPDSFLQCGKRAWVITGGQSGPGAHPMHPDWARGLRDQCVPAGIAYHHKQWGEWLQIDGTDVKVGKKAAGRTLDGKVWDEVPRPLF